MYEMNISCNWNQHKMKVCVCVMFECIQLSQANDVIMIACDIYQCLFPEYCPVIFGV